MKFKKLSIIALSTVLVLAFAGCGKKPIEPNNSGETNSGTVQAYKKEITVASNDKITTLNPQGINNTVHNRIFVLSHDTLIGYNHDQKTFYPKLAESWNLEDDGVTWSFNLRKDVTFHNGSPFNASDVIFSFNRGKTEAVASAKYMFNNIKNLEIVNDHQIKMELNTPNMDWEFMLAQSPMSILDEESVTENVENVKFGTGQWKHLEYKEGDFVKLGNYEKYWGEKNPTEVLIYKTIPEASSRVIALQNGEIDICLSPSTSELDFIAADPNLDLVQFNSSALHYLAFNVQKAPGNDIKLRQAIAYAINYDDIITGAYDGYGTKGTVFWGFQQAYYIGDKIEGYNYNLEKAKQIMAESKYKDGVTIDIMTTTKQRVTALEILQAQLKEIGVTVNVVEVDSAGFTAQTNEGEHQACMYGLSFNDHADDSRRAYLSTSTTNKSLQNNPRIHEIMDLAVVEKDPTKRAELYEEWQNIAIEECAVVPITYMQSFVGVNKNIQGIMYEPGGRHNFNNVKIPV